MDSANVNFYSDSGGLPGSQVATRPNLTVGDTNGSLTISIPSAVTLPAGHYWVSVQANMDFPVGGQWGWTDRTVQSNNEAAWQNPGGGFGVCPTWGARWHDVRDRRRRARSGLPPARLGRRPATTSATTSAASATRVECRGTVFADHRPLRLRTERRRPRCDRRRLGRHPRQHGQSLQRHHEHVDASGAHPGGQRGAVRRYVERQDLRRRR